MIPLLAGAALVGAVWAALLVPDWVRRTTRAQGHWALAGLIYLSGPVNAVIQLTYSGGAPSGVGLLLARGNTVAVWTLGIVGVLSAIRDPRPRQLLLLLPLLAFYVSLYISSAFGYAPTGLPEEYLITPVIVIPFVLHSGYSWQWLAGVLRRALRALIVLSLVSVPLLPSVAYDQECCRTIFGVERIQGITGHPNTLAILACFAILLEIRGGRLLWLIPEGVALLFAQSTTGWVALTLGILALAGGLGRSARAVALLGAACAAWFAITDRSLVTDFFPPEFWTFTGRTTIWQAALHGFFLDPVLGYGPRLLDEQYRAQYLGSFDAAAQAHNQIVQSLGESGILGLLCLLALVAALFRGAFRARAATHGLSVALLLAFCSRLMSETPLRPQGATATVLIQIAILGIIAAGDSVTRRPQTDTEGLSLDEVTIPESALAPSTAPPRPRRSLVPAAGRTVLRTSRGAP